MATTNAEPIPTSHTNGVIEDGYDEDDKMKMRPADIDADMREMERRKRVELIMNSRLFREELERIIESQMRDGNNSAGLLQQISEMVGSKYNNHFLRNASCAVPINDIRGLEAMGFVKGEKILRCKLAALFRLIDLYGWSQNIYNHVTARLSHQEEHFLVNPYGLLYSEVTASSLAKVDMQGGVIESGTTNFNVSVAGFKLHAAIYAFRPDLKCIIHLHTPSVLAISSLKDGLLPLCQEAAVIGDISLYAYTGTPTESEERDKIARSLGPNNKVIFLTNHGALCCGETIEETFFNAYNIVSACETQLKVLPLGKDNLLLLSDETRKSMYDGARKMPENIAPAASNAISEKRWRVGGLEFEALMRMLDNAGFRTGYMYRTPLIKGELPRPRNDVEVPPAVSSLGYLLEEEEMYNKGLWRKQFGHKGNDRIRWLNSPNVYQKVEILETGTTDPRKITKWVGPNNEEWVAEGSPNHTSTPVKIENALQFVPKNTNPKEFKKLQQQIKDNRRADKITSGPQSHILEGVSWEEAKKLQDANMSGTSDQVILVGAASKGIIQREYQHNATVYKTPYAKNPFDAMTDEELENYKKDIDRKQRGSSYYDEDESDSLPVKGVTSETEDDSLAHETRVIRIQTSTAPKESRAEVVLSDDGKKSKSKFMQSLGSMLSLRRELATSSFVDQVSITFTSVWEMRVFHPAARLIATVEVVSHPSENGRPVVIHLSADDDDEIDSLDVVTSECALQRIAEQLTSEFGNGNAFLPAIRSFDSSEVEFTTYTEIRSPQTSNAAVERRSESLHDFSSSATTDDEDEAPSSPDCNAAAAAACGLQPSLSLSSLTSCTGAEYEEYKAPPPLSLLDLEHEGWKEMCVEDVQELTTSFKSTSDDTSADDLTVIHRPPGANKSLEKDDDLSDFDSISDDDGDAIEESDCTYSSYSNVDYDEQMPQALHYAEIAANSKCRETKFYTDLSIIYEEERDRSRTNVLQDGTNDVHPTKISECSEGTEDGRSAFPLSGYESASTLETDSLEMDDSTNVKLSPGQSEMTWTVDDLSSMDETDECRGPLLRTENDVLFAPSNEKVASFENEFNDSDQISRSEDERATCEANETYLTEDECLSLQSNEHEPADDNGQNSDHNDVVKEEESPEVMLETNEIFHDTSPECGETEQVPFDDISTEEYPTIVEKNALEITRPVTPKSLGEDEHVGVEESEILDEDSENRPHSSDLSAGSENFRSEDQNVATGPIVRTDNDFVPCDENQSDVVSTDEHPDLLNCASNHSAGGSYVSETINTVPEGDETGQVPLYEITAEEYSAYEERNDALKITHSATSKTSVENEDVIGVEESEIPDEDSENRSHSSDLGAESEDFRSEDQSVATDEVVYTDTDFFPFDENKSDVVLKDEHPDLHSAGGSDVPETINTIPECDETGEVLLHKINEEKNDAFETSKTSVENEDVVGVEESEILDEDGENRPHSSDLSTESEDFRSEDQNVATDQVVHTDTDFVPFDENQNIISSRKEPSDFESNDHHVEEENRFENGIMESENSVDSDARNEESNVHEQSTEIDLPDSANHQSFESSPLERTILLSHMLSRHVQSYILRNGISDVTSIESDTPSAEVVDVFPSFRNAPTPATPEAPANDSSVHSEIDYGAALVHALENLENFDSDQTGFREAAASSKLLSEAEPFGRVEFVAGHRDNFEERVFEEDPVSTAAVENPESNDAYPKGFSAENEVSDDRTDLVPSSENCPITLSRRGSVGNVNNSFEVCVTDRATHTALDEGFVAVERSSGPTPIDGEHSQSENCSPLEKEDRLDERSPPSSEISAVVSTNEGCDVGRVPIEGETNRDQDTLEEGNRVFDEYSITPSLKNLTDTMLERKSSDSNQIEVVMPLMNEAICVQTSDDNELEGESSDSDEVEEVFASNEADCIQSFDQNELKDESSDPEEVDEVLPLKEANCVQSSDSNEFEGEASDSEEIKEVIPPNEADYVQTSDQNESKGESSDPEEVDEVLPLSEANCVQSSDLNEVEGEASDSEEIKEVLPENEADCVQTSDQSELKGESSNLEEVEKVLPLNQAECVQNSDQNELESKSSDSDKVEELRLSNEADCATNSNENDSRRTSSNLEEVEKVVSLIQENRSDSSEDESSDSDEVEELLHVNEEKCVQSSNQNEIKGESSDNDEDEEVPPVNEGNCVQNSDQNELKDESSYSEKVDEVLPLNGANCVQNSDRNEFQDEFSDSDTVEEILPLNEENGVQSSDQNELKGESSDFDEVEEVLPLNEANYDQNENPKITYPETEPFNVGHVDELSSQFKQDSDDTSHEEIPSEQNTKASPDVNSFVSCHYDYNHNEVPVDEEKNAENTTQLRRSSDCGDFQLTLSLHIEWDDESVAQAPSLSGESTPVVNDEPSPRVDDSDAGESPNSPHRYIRSLYILKDFKHNYPKFIQYSDFSPKIRSRCKRPPGKWPFTPHRKRATSAASTSKGQDRRHESSADSGGYRRYSELTADWPPSNSHQGTSARVADESSTELPASKSKSTCSSNFDCNLKFGARVRASTPKGNNGKVCQSPNRTSLEEFEFYESFFDTK